MVWISDLSHLSGPHRHWKAASAPQSAPMLHTTVCEFIFPHLTSCCSAFLHNRMAWSANSNGHKGCKEDREMCCPALSRIALSASTAHWKFQTGISIFAILPCRLEGRRFCQCLRRAPHPLLNPPFKPFSCFSTNTNPTTVWHLDVTANTPHAVAAALASYISHHHLYAHLER